MSRLFHLLLLAAAWLCAHLLLRGGGPEVIAGLPLILRALLALGMLLLGLRGFAGSRGRSSLRAARSRRRRRWLDHALAACGLLVMHFILLWMLGAAPPVVERIGIAVEPWLRPEHAEKRADLIASAAENTASGDLLWQDRRSRSLPPRTNLRPGSRPEVFIRFDTPADASSVIGKSAYLSAFTLSRYEAGRWTTRGTEPSPVAESPPGRSRFPVPPARNVLRPVMYEVFHGANPSGQNVMIALQGFEFADIAPLLAYEEGFVMLPAAGESTSGYQYRAASRPQVLADLEGDIRIPMDPGFDAELLAIPESARIASFLASQARGIVGESPTVAGLVALESWLQNAFEYSLETTNPENLDPLENFLFSERRGHCEHFAMTGALMLRAIGIPSRVTYGWAGGTWYESSRLMVFRSRDAHAWTELWLPDHGWVVMDPTPPGGVHGTRSRIAPPEESPPDPVEEFSHEYEEAEVARIDHVALVLLAASTLAAIGLVCWRRWGGSSPILAASERDSDARTPGYLAAWATACPTRHPGETLRQQIARLEDPPHFAKRLLDYHYQIQYRQTGPKPRFERALERDIRNWQRARDSRNSQE